MYRRLGTDGFRGEANVDLTVEQAFQIGRFLGWYYGRDHRAKVVIGKDTRRSSYMFEDALSSGLTASGADVYLLHVTTTPSVSFVVRTEEDFDCGIMITASHNPYYDNGIRLLNGRGEKLEDSVLRELVHYLNGDMPEVPLARRDAIGCTTDYASGRNRYIGYLIMLATRSLKNWRIGLDCANGSAFTIAKSVFDALGAKTYVINAQPDGTNINRGCGSTHIGALQQAVREHQLDVGFAYDGDADRCIAVDETGMVVDGDRILYLCACYMKEKGQLETNTVVTTVMSNLGLYRALDREGIRYVKTPVGDKFVYEAMQENGHRLGGEQSGHIIFGKYASTGDGILTSLKIMEVMLERKLSLHALAEQMTRYPQLLKNVRVRSRREACEDPAVQEEVRRIERELGESGRILVRESLTEPVVRIMVEAADSADCERLVGRVAEVLRERGHAVGEGQKEYD